MTASKKKTVRTRRGVEPTGRPARPEAERAIFLIRKGALPPSAGSAAPARRGRA